MSFFAVLLMVDTIARFVNFTMQVDVIGDGKSGQGIGGGYLVGGGSPIARSIFSGNQETAVLCPYGWIFGW